MCKDTFGKKAINWRSATPPPPSTPRLHRMRPDRPRFFFFFAAPRPSLTAETRRFLAAPSGRRRRARPDGVVSESAAPVGGHRELPPALGEPRRQEDDPAHELINECGATACQNLTPIVKLRAKRKIYRDLRWISLTRQINYDGRTRKWAGNKHGIGTVF